MERLLEAIAEMGNQNTPEMVTIRGLTLLASRQICYFCQGRGHRIMECASKRKLDRSFRKFELRALWGDVKATLLRENIEVNVQTRDARNTLVNQGIQQAMLRRRTRLNQQAQQNEVVMGGGNGNQQEQVPRQVGNVQNVRPTRGNQA